MALTRSAELVATSYADDLSLRALADVARLTDDVESRIVGGQMVAILLTAFPVADLAPRRTRDADTAITTEVAGSGLLHERLTADGYVPTAGNSYAKTLPSSLPANAPVRQLSIDVIVPSTDGRFRAKQLGGRGFDSVPGLALALSGDPIFIETGVTLLDGTVLSFTPRVPTVEAAVVIKSHAFASRRQASDVEDLYRLLEIVDRYTATEIGGWRLKEERLVGSRLDAAIQMHELLRTTRTLRDIDVPSSRLAALIARHVGRP